MWAFVTLCAALVFTSVVGVDGNCGMCTVKDLPVFEDKRVTDHVVWTEQNVTGRAECAARCNQHDPAEMCGYNQNTGDCVAYNATFTDPSSVIYYDDSGYRMYSLCPATPLGWCSSPSDCAMADTVCMDRGCVCNAALVFSEVAGGCVPAPPPYFGTCTSSCSGTNVVCNNGYCVCDIMYVKRGSRCVQDCGGSGYGSGFTIFHDKALNGYNDRVVSSILTIEACTSLCQAESGFTCVTGDYQHGTGTCYLSSTAWYNAPASSTVNSTAYHQIIRNCA